TLRRQRRARGRPVSQPPATRRDVRAPGSTSGVARDLRIKTTSVGAVVNDPSGGTGRKVVLAKRPVSTEEWPAEPENIKRSRRVPARRGAAIGPILDHPASTAAKA